MKKHKSIWSLSFSALSNITFCNLLFVDIYLLFFQYKGAIFEMVPVLIFYHCIINDHKPSYLSAIQIYNLTVSEARSPAHVKWVLCSGSHKVEINLLARFIFMWRFNLEKCHLQVPSGRWQNSFFCSSMTEVPIFFASHHLGSILSD